jgi:hypothetical protein
MDLLTMKTEERIRRATDELSEDSTWRSLDGKYTVIKDMDDSYLCNLTNYAKKSRGRPGMYDFFTKLMNITTGLLVARGKGSMLLDGEQIPYRNEKGEWVKWDYERGPVPIDEGDLPYLDYLESGPNL